MENKDLDQLFDGLKGNFDVETPKAGHESRFLDRLNNATSEAVVENTSQFNWKPFLAIAASVIICLSAFMAFQSQQEDVHDLASVSPELSKTQDFFTATIEVELKRLNEERSPLTDKLINDAIEDIHLLEQDYQNLKINLTESDNDQRVIHAMIANFQSRIDILNTVLEEIEDIKQLKNNNYDTKTTI